MHLNMQGFQALDLFWEGPDLKGKDSTFMNYMVTPVFPIVNPPTKSPLTFQVQP